MTEQTLDERPSLLSNPMLSLATLCFSFPIFGGCNKVETSASPKQEPTPVLTRTMTIPSFCLSEQSLVPADKIVGFSPQDRMIVTSALNVLDQILPKDDPSRIAANRLPIIAVTPETPLPNPQVLAAHIPVWATIQNTVTGEESRKLMSENIYVNSLSRFENFFEIVGTFGHELFHAAHHLKDERGLGKDFHKETEATGAECNYYLALRTFVNDSPLIKADERASYGKEWLGQIDRALLNSRKLHFHYYTQNDLWNLRAQLHGAAKHADKINHTSSATIARELATLTEPIFEVKPFDRLDLSTIRGIFDKAEEIFAADPAFKDNPQSEKTLKWLAECKARLSDLDAAQEKYFTTINK